MEQKYYVSIKTTNTQVKYLLTKLQTVDTYRILTKGPVRAVKVSGRTVTIYKYAGKRGICQIEFYNRVSRNKNVVYNLKVTFN